MKIKFWVAGIAKETVDIPDEEIQGLNREEQIEVIEAKYVKWVDKHVDSGWSKEEGNEKG
jgi:hypothetical protein